MTSNKQYLYNKYNIITKYPSFGCCHRLDINTSGMIFIGTTNHAKCRHIISDKINTIKIYVCLVNGIIKNKNGYIKKYIKCTNIPIFCKTYDTNENDALGACSYYTVYKEYIYDNKYYSLVHIRIFTGRTHQIRIHMKSIGHSLVSDDKYTDKLLYKDNITLFKRIFLHNFFLSFIYKKRYTFKCDLPQDLASPLKKIELINKYETDHDILNTSQI